MKKIRVLAFALCLPFFAAAQPGPLDVQLGLKAGVNFSKLNGSTWSGGYKAGLHGGAFLSANVKKLGGQIEAYYSQASYTASGAELHKASLNAGKMLLKNTADSAKNGEISVSYINVPLLLNLNLFGNATIQLGPQYTGVLSVKDKDNLLADAGSFLSNSDVSGVIGVWLNLPKKLNAGVRYTFGLSDMNFSSVGESWKNRNIQVHIGFSFL